MKAKTETKIKAIMFDMGNVLLFFDAKRASKAFAEATGIPEQQIWEGFFISQFEKSYTRGEISTQEFFARASEFLGEKLDFETFARFWNEIFTANHEMESILQRLKKHYRLYVISNTNDLHFEYIRREFDWLLRYFDKCFPSHEVGHRKPEPGIFHHVLKDSGLKAEETIFIDDIPEFAASAEKVGIRAVLFKSCGELEDELKRMGIKL